MLSKKDLININKNFHTGKITNENSLDYALEQARKTRDWLKSLAYLVRAILIDHVFEDGNKRTAASIIAACLEIKGMSFDPEKIDSIIIIMIKKNISQINKIMRLIKNVIK